MRVNCRTFLQTCHLAGQNAITIHSFTHSFLPSFQVSANNILLIHLALVDVLLCFFFFAFALPTIARGTDNWLQNGQWEWACTMEGVFLMLLHPMAMWTTCGLNCDRFYAIASPLHYSAIVNPRRVFIGLGIGWLVVLLLSIPPLVTRIAPYVFVPELAACFPGFANLNSIYYTGFYTLVTFIVPATIILGCNFKVSEMRGIYSSSASFSNILSPSGAANSKASSTSHRIRHL